MSVNEQRLAEKLMEAIDLLEGHDDAEYERLPPQAKANYQEALEFLSRLESSIADPENAENSEGSDDSRQRTDGGQELPLDCDLSSTLGRDESLAGPFSSQDVVIYDPEEEVVAERWISMDYGATISLEDSR